MTRIAEPRDGGNQFLLHAGSMCKLGVELGKDLSPFQGERRELAQAHDECEVARRERLRARPRQAEHAHCLLTGDEGHGDNRGRSRVRHEGRTRLEDRAQHLEVLLVGRSAERWRGTAGDTTNEVAGAGLDQAQEGVRPFDQPRGVLDDAFEQRVGVAFPGESESGVVERLELAPQRLGLAAARARGVLVHSGAHVRSDRSLEAPP